MIANPQQRTLLPYRLAREAAAAAILEEVSWRHDNSDIERLIEQIILARTDDARTLARRRLTVALIEFMHSDFAVPLCFELAETSAAVALFECEWKFPHGFALVPMSFYRPTAGGAA